MILLAGLVFAMRLNTPGILLQYPRQRTVAPRGGRAVVSNTDAIATFTGVFKAADKKYLTIGLENGESMRMYITGSTRFFRNGKPARARDFEVDEPVTVDASRDMLMNLLAVRVERTDGKPPATPPK